MATAAIAPPHWCAILHSQVPSQVVTRAHWPHHQKTSHDRVLQVVSNSHKRSQIVTAITRGYTAGVAEAASELDKCVRRFTVFREDQPNRPSKAGRSHVGPDDLQRLLKPGKQARLHRGSPETVETSVVVITARSPPRSRVRSPVGVNSVNARTYADRMRALAQTDRCDRLSPSLDPTSTRTVLTPIRKTGNEAIRRSPISPRARLRSHSGHLRSPTGRASGILAGHLKVRGRLAVG
jgi:hypothetical protein